MMDPTTAGLLGFLFGISFWGWALVLLEFVILFPLMAYDKSELATISLIVGGVAAYFLFGWNIASIVWYNPGASISCVLAYFLIGMLWSMFRWSQFAVECRVLFDEKVATFIQLKKKNLNLTQNKTAMNFREPPKEPFSEEVKKRILASLNEGKIPDELLEEWRNSFAWSQSYPPSPVDNKRKITTWISFWPWSLIWYIIRDLFRELVDAIYKRLSGLYWSISRRQFANADARLFKNRE